MSRKRVPSLGCSCGWRAVSATRWGLVPQRRRAPDHPCTSVTLWAFGIAGHRSGSDGQPVSHLQECPRLISEEAHSLQDDDVVAFDADLGILHSKKLPSVLTGEMSRLYAAGFSLMPLGGDTGRRPLLSFKKSDGAPIGRHSLARVIGRMAGGGSENYAIRLKGMLVIDIDTDTPEAREGPDRPAGAIGGMTIYRRERVNGFRRQA